MSLRILAASAAFALSGAGLAAPQPPSAAAPGAAPPSTASEGESRGMVGDAVVVLPFGGAEGAEPDWLSDGIAEFLSEALALGGQSVVSDERRADVLDDSGLAEEPRLTLASACLLGRQAGARRVVTGTWTASGTSLSVSARLIDVVSMKERKKTTARGTVDGLGPLLAGLASQLLPGRTPDPVVQALGATPQEALIPWLQAAAEPDVATQHLEASLQARPDVIPALLALAEARLTSGMPDDAARTAARVPSSAPVHHRALAMLLQGRAELDGGDAGKAVASLAEAVKLEAGRETLVWLGEAQLAARDRTAAAISARRVLELVPGDEHALSILERLEGGATPPAASPTGGTPPSG